MIYYHNEDILFKKKNRLKFRTIIRQLLLDENLELGMLNYIFCSDNYILDLNRTSLNHDFYTDIITFDYREDVIVSGDLFISIDRVLDNASSLGNSFLDELHRVMFHGVLHICGYGDKTKEEIHIMRAKESYYLQKLNTII